MRLRSLYLIAFFLFLFSGNASFAQERTDSVIVENKLDTSGKNVLALDPAVKKKFDPKVATFRSAVLPGWGQAYNKKYWKIPIIYGALGTTVVVFFDNIKTYKLLRQAVIYLSDTISANDALIDERFQSFPVESLRGYRNIFRQNVDYSVLVFLGFWALNVVDATVDAHLKAFDVSSDISMKIRPGFNYTTNSPGISLVFFFKDKHASNF
jgi:hypothetical protein